MSIIVNVVNQRMHVSSTMDGIVDGSRNFVKFKFNLSNEWDGLITFAQFGQGGVAYNRYLDDKNEVYLPQEIHAGTCTLMLYGSQDTTIATTNCLTFKVDKNALISDATSVEIPEPLYDRLITQIQEHTADCNTAIADLQSRLNKKYYYATYGTTEMTSGEIKDNVYTLLKCEDDVEEVVSQFIIAGGTSNSPIIGDNGNWWVGDEDTGVKAAGEDGRSVYGMDLVESQSDETQSVYNMYDDGDRTIGSFTVYHGRDGKDGADGISPTISVSDTTSGHRITITDADSTKTIDVMDGSNGQRGSDGKDGNGIKSVVLNADYTLTLTFDDDTSYTTPSIRGATGDNGSAGKDGCDGVGISSIEQTTTSTVDGGDNVFTATLTNGNKATFIVKNGNTGTAGTDGEDYVLTDADKAEIASLVPNVYTPEAPIFANGVPEMTDTSKVYVNMETGTFWRYQEATVTKEVTVTDAIEATDDNPYHDSSRLTSSTTDDTFSADARGYHVTPLIDLTKPEYVGKTIQVHLEGAQYASTGAYAQWIQCRGYRTNKAILIPRPYTCDSASVGNSIVSITSGISVTYNSDTSAVLTITILPTYSFSDPTEIGYIRFCGKGAVADSNIYITYTNTEAVTETTWVDTGMTYTSAISEEEKQQIADDIIARIDTELLSVVGSGEVV